MESTERKTRVNLLVVATGKYTQFLEGLLDSADQFFLKGCEVNYCVFSDQEESVVRLSAGKEWADDCLGFTVEHKPFPYPTLHRFHFFKEHKDQLPEADYFFYVDVDALFVAPVTEEVLGERVAVQHCGYIGERGTYETRRNSACYVAPNEGKQYFGGGFWGFSEDEFWRLTYWAVKAIDGDEARDIIPVWHDESAVNRWLIDNPPSKILSPSYHYPQNNPHIYGKWKAKGLKFEPILLLLEKDHKAVR